MDLAENDKMTLCSWSEEVNAWHGRDSVDVQCDDDHHMIRHTHTSHGTYEYHRPDGS